MKKTLKQWTAITCVLVMIAGLLPVSILAEDSVATPTDLAPVAEFVQETEPAEEVTENPAEGPAAEPEEEKVTYTARIAAAQRDGKIFLTAVVEPKLVGSVIWEMKNPGQADEKWTRIEIDSQTLLIVPGSELIGKEIRFRLEDGTTSLLNYIVPELETEADEPAVEEPKAEEPEVEEPVIEESAVEEPVAEESEAQEPAVEESEAEEPEVEEPAAEEAEAKEPVAEEHAVQEPAAEESEAEEPEAEEPVVEEPAIEESEVEEPVAEEPEIQEPAVEESEAEEPEAEETEDEDPAGEEPAREEIIINEPIEKKNAAEEPKVEKTENVKTPSLEELEEYETPLGLDEYTRIVLTDPDQEIVSLREAADGMSPIIADVEKDTEIVVIEVEDDWVKVIVGETEGYIFIEDIRSYLLPTDDVAEEKPIEEEPDGTGEEVPAEEEAEDPTANMKVTIFTSRRKTVRVGEPVTLTSRIEGFDGFEIRYQWECDKHDGAGFLDVSGACEDSYTFSASAESMSWDWRLSVYYY
ncbi:hypothetical protein JNO48_05405 [Clostridiales bacterium]|nr:hypothetical protein JNO48_05405 [Clostridiales bacterium]